MIRVRANRAPPAKSQEDAASKTSVPPHARDRAKQDGPRWPRAGRDPWHPIPIGESVSVIGLVGKNPPFIEGHAVIRAAAQGHHRYRVQFLGDPIFKERVVHPAFQDDLERVLAILIELWCAQSEASANFSDFFPPEDI